MNYEEIVKITLVDCVVIYPLKWREDDDNRKFGNLIESLYESKSDDEKKLYWRI